MHSDFELTKQEKNVLDLLGDAYNEFRKLEEQHPDDNHEFRSGIHASQAIVAMRPSRRSNRDKLYIKENEVCKGNTPQEEIKKGDFVNYHAIIGGEVTSTGHEVKYTYTLDCGTEVAMITNKGGCVALKALSLCKLNKGDNE